MKKQILALTLATLMSLPVHALSHRGGNGGDDTEIELKTRMLQIGAFLNSTVGKSEFKILNSETITNSINQIEIRLESDPVLDRFNKERTCVNEVANMTVTCNAQKIIALINEKQNDILVGLLFHEILGINQVELGYQDLVSSYPISSKIIPFTQLILDTEIQEKSIRPEFYGLDSRSYGVTYVNKETKETLRMICLNDNIEVNRCKNFNVVRKLDNMQSPVLTEIASLNRAEIQKINSITVPSNEDLVKLNQRIEELNQKGFKYLTFSWKQTVKRQDEYAFGVGLNQGLYNEMDIYRFEYEVYGNILILPLAAKAIDLSAETVKQTGNILIYPFKAIVNGIRSASLHSQKKKIVKRLGLIKSLLNSEDNLSLVNKQVAVSDEDFLSLVEASKGALITIKGK